MDVCQNCFHGAAIGEPFSNLLRNNGKRDGLASLQKACCIHPFQGLANRDREADRLVMDMVYNAEEFKAACKFRTHWIQIGRGAFRVNKDEEVQSAHIHGRREADGRDLGCLFGGSAS